MRICKPCELLNSPPPPTHKHLRFFTPINYELDLHPSHIKYLSNQSIVKWTDVRITKLTTFTANTSALLLLDLKSTRWWVGEDIFCLEIAIPMISLLNLVLQRGQFLPECWIFCQASEHCSQNKCSHLVSTNESTWLLQMQHRYWHVRSQPFVWVPWSMV